MARAARSRPTAHLAVSATHATRRNVAVMTPYPLINGLPMLPRQIGREEARERARRELEEHIYRRDDPSLVERVLTWLAEQLGEVSERGADLAPGGWAGLVAILALLVLVVVAIRLRVGPLRRSHHLPGGAFAGPALTAGQHRAAAERAAAAGQWADAVRERLRAVARDLEQRVIIDPNPGRTADELAAEAGAALPAFVDDLAAAARTFDDIWYGTRAATPAAYDHLRRLDEALRAAKPTAADAGKPGEDRGPRTVSAGQRP